MSSGAYGDPDTRRRILDAALRLTSQLGPSMRLADVAKAAGVSHQGLYLHFRGRHALLVALLGHMVESFGLESLSQAVVAAPDGREAVARLVEFVYTLNLRLEEVGWVLEEAQHIDEAFGRDWRHRTKGLRDFIREKVVSRLAGEGVLGERWSVESASDLIIGLTNLGTWRIYVRDLGWSRRRYIESLTAMIVAGLTGS